MFFQLYTVTNGLHYTDDEYQLQQLWLIPNYFLLSIDEARELYQKFPRNYVTSDIFFSGIEPNMDTLDMDFDSSWFPVMASGMGGYLFLNLSDGSLFEYSPFEAIHKKHNHFRQENIYEFFKNVLEGFENGDFVVGDDLVVSGRKQRDLTDEVSHSRFKLQHKSDKKSKKVNEVQPKNNRQFKGGIGDLLEERALLEEEQKILDEERRILKKEREMLNQQIRMINDKETLFHEMTKRKKRELQKSQSLSFTQKRIVGLPTMKLSCTHIKQVCHAISSAVLKRDWPHRMCLLKDRDKVFQNRALTCGAEKRSRGYDCNTYPLLSTRQGSKVNGVTTMIIPTIQNNIFGMQMRGFYKSLEFKSQVSRHLCFRISLIP